MAHPLKNYPDKICEHCGKVFNRRRFGDRLDDCGRYQKRRFCSLKCSGYKENPKDRTSFCKRAQEFKRTVCEICGITENLEVHHKDGDITSNTEKNTQTLCHPCHMRLHWKLRKRGIVFGSHKKQSTQIVSTDLKPSATQSCQESHAKSSEQ